MKSFREIVIESVSRKSAKDILSHADNFSTEKAAKSWVDHAVKPQNYSIILDTKTKKYLVLTNKERGIVTKKYVNRFEDIKYITRAK